MIEVVAGILLVWAIVFRAGAPVEKLESHGYRLDLEKKHDWL